MLLIRLLVRLGYGVRPSRVYCSNGAEINAVDETKLAALLDRFKAAQPRSTAVFCDSDMFVPAIYRGLQQRGIVPGRDVEIVRGNNDQIYLAGLPPPPVTADVRAVELGRLAVERLLWRISHPEAPIVALMISPRLEIPANLTVISGTTQE